LLIVGHSDDNLDMVHRTSFLFANECLNNQLTNRCVLPASYRNKNINVQLSANVLHL